MKALRFVGCLLIFAQFSFVADSGKRPAADCTVAVKANDEQGIVSPNIMGFNIVYCYESDAGWDSGKGKVSQMVKALGTKQLRYPGGTVVTKYHWEDPTGQGWVDSWSPEYNPAKNTDPSVFMNIDEYLSVVKTQKIEPLVGINMGSGMKYKRVQNGVDEAVRLMKHCLAKGVKVKYYYLDNEPYQPDANFTYTPEQYAEAINTYVPAMKKVDPDIKIIANTHPNADLYTKALLVNAGKNIDFIDVHMYWRYKSATYENWKKEGLMKHRGVSPYSQQNEIFQKIFNEAGYPNIKLVILEWNIGPPGDNVIGPTEAEGALMVAEQYTQFIQSGLFMSTFWPLSWPGTSFRALLDAPGQYKPFKMYDMFALYKDVLGQQRVSSTGTVTNLINLAVKSKDGKTMWVYLINKQQDKDELAVDLSLDGFIAKSFSSSAFDANDTTAGGLKISKLEVNRATSNSYSLKIPKNSFVKLTFKK